MTKSIALVALSALVLAGCGATPTAPVATKAGVMRAASSDARRVELRIPARLFGYVEEHAAQLKAEHEQEFETDMYGRPTHRKYRVVLDKHSRTDVRLVVSRDGFKTTLNENSYNDYRRQDGRDVLVPFVTTPGAVKYYLEVHAKVENVATGKLVKKLPVHYISDMGANFDGKLEAKPF